MHARQVGRRVEVIGRRSETASVYANPDGSFTMEQYARPVRVQRGAGWVPVDTTLRRTSDGSVAPGATTAGLRFSGGGSGPFVVLSEAAWSVSLTWPLPLPVPRLSGDTATYGDVLPGVDLAATATDEGFSERLVVRSRAGASDPRLAEIRFALAGNGAVFRPVANGGMVGLDRTGTEVVTVYRRSCPR